MITQQVHVVPVHSTVSSSSFSMRKEIILHVQHEWREPALLCIAQDKVLMNAICQTFDQLSKYCAVWEKQVSCLFFWRHMCIFLNASRTPATLFSLCPSSSFLRITMLPRRSSGVIVLHTPFTWHPPLPQISDTCCIVQRQRNSFSRLQSHRNIPETWLRNPSSSAYYPSLLAYYRPVMCTHFHNECLFLA